MNHMVKNSINIFCFIALLCAISCTSGENNKGQKKDGYKNPSVDRSDPSLPPGSPFLASSLLDIMPVHAGGFNKFSATNGTPKLLNTQNASMARVVYRDGEQENCFGNLRFGHQQFLLWIA